MFNNTLIFLDFKRHFPARGFLWYLIRNSYLVWCMRPKLFHFFLIIASVTGYLEWGDNNRVFVFQAEYDIILKMFTSPSEVIHPLILLPIFGQIILLATLFQNRPKNHLLYLGIGGISILYIFLLIIGILSLNFKILIASLPFLIFSVFTIKYYKNRDS